MPIVIVTVIPIRHQQKNCMRKQESQMTIKKPRPKTATKNEHLDKNYRLSNKFYLENYD